MNVELLAPAQNLECAISAINYGADAIYIGANAFGARASAGNSLDDIEKIVNYAHKFYVKVFCTINTILDDNEIQQAKILIQNLYNIGVDAIIIQDMGILELAINNELAPIVIHASTQCDNRTLEKVQFFENVGLERVILARELSIKEIENICKNTNCEIETFVHGALCVSFSGQCYLSQSIGGRSANRGECAQPCRKKYSLVDEKGIFLAKDQHLLSLKDFNASEHLDKLAKIGVFSFKIEGRLKDENYIKNVVAFYCKKLEKFGKKTSSGTVFLDFEPDLKKSFNRGFCDYFLDGRKKIFNFESPKSIGEKIGKIEQVGKNYFVIKNNNLHAQDGLYFNGTGCLVNKVDGDKIYPNKMNEIKEGLIVYRNSDFEFEKQLKVSKSKRQISVKITVLDDKIEAIDEDNNSVALDFNVSNLANNQEKMKENFVKHLQKTGESDFFAETIAIKAKNLIFLPVSQINKLRNELFEKLMQKRLSNYPKKKQAKLQYAKFPEKQLDFRANVHNKLAKTFYEKCSCNIIENSIESGTSTKEKPIMTTKHCLKYAFNLCKKPINLYLIDEKNKKYELKFDCKNCQMQIFNCQ